MADTIHSLKQDALKAHKENRYEDACRLYADYFKLRPDDAIMWSNFGVLQRVNNNPKQALRAQKKAYSLNQNVTSIFNNYANALSDIGQYEESIVFREKVLGKEPNSPQQLSMIGRCLRGMGQYDQSIAWLKDTLKAYPNDAEMALQLSFSELSAGYYKDGFRTYKSRWNTEHLEARALSFPEWQGEPLEGKTIVILPEQGFGDAILVARFISKFKAKGARVICYVKKPLRRLFEGIEGSDALISDLGELKGVDYWVNNIDLAELYFRDHDDIPAPMQINVPQDCTERAKAMIEPYRTKFKIGVVWNGSVTYKNNVYRSFHHTDFLPLTDIPNVQLFSLYKGPSLDAYHADGSSSFMIDVGSYDRDFADCAGLMQEMDLIITSDTVTAHLAGSLGVKVWTILHWDPFWLWGHSSQTTPWYPTMRLFRQDEPLDWSGVHKDVKHTLETELKG